MRAEEGKKKEEERGKEGRGNRLEWWTLGWPEVYTFSLIELVSRSRLCLSLHSVVSPFFLLLSFSFGCCVDDVCFFSFCARESEVFSRLLFCPLGITSPRWFKEGK